MVLIGGVFVVAATTASNTVATTRTADSTTPVDANLLKPPECAALTLVGVVGGAGRVDGTVGNMLVLGSAGNDDLRGKNGNDCLVGGAGNDRIRGDRGNDVCIGGPGDDQLEKCEFCYGGPGNDTFAQCNWWQQ